MKLRKQCIATHPGISGVNISDQPYWGQRCARFVWFGHFHAIHWTEKLKNGVSYSWHDEKK